MAVLKWKASGPARHPFEASVGESTEYCVHLAECNAVEDGEIRAALSDSIEKGLSFAAVNLRDNITRLLFLWDMVYADLTILYTDESMENDAPQVATCTFAAIDAQLQEFSEIDEDEWELAAEATSARIRQFLEDLLGSYELKVLLPSLTVYFSDQDRATGADEFVAHQIKTG